MIVACAMIGTVCASPITSSSTSSNWYYGVFPVRHPHEVRCLVPLYINIIFGTASFTNIRFQKKHSTFQLLLRLEKHLRSSLSSISTSIQRSIWVTTASLERTHGRQPVSTL
jgi:hypothetical protein